MDLRPKGIANLVKSCFSTFKKLLASLSKRPTGKIAVDAWNDEVGRFRVWSGNPGAHQTGSSSLSYRLRHAPSIEQEIIETLDALLQAVQEVIEVLDDATAEIDDLYIDELYEDVVDSINGLFRLSSVIRNSSRRDQILERSQFDRSMEPYDRNHVRDMLPRVSDILVERLGRANTQRRANFRYLQRHHEKLAQGHDDDHNECEDAADHGYAKSRLSGTVATEFSATTNSVEEEDDASITASVTSYASSLFRISNRRFPSKPAPTTADGRFECPLCFYLVRATDTASWRKHVFLDLQPYVCIFPQCERANKLFTSRRDWFAHEIEQHVKSGETLTLCSLCGDILTDLTAEKHLGRHLEDLALFTLPSLLFDDEGDDDDDDHNYDNLQFKDNADQKILEDYENIIFHDQDTVFGKWHGVNTGLEENPRDQLGQPFTNPMDFVQGQPNSLMNAEHVDGNAATTKVTAEIETQGWPDVEQSVTLQRFELTHQEITNLQEEMQESPQAKAVRFVAASLPYGAVLHINKTDTEDSIVSKLMEIFKLPQPKFVTFTNLAGSRIAPTYDHVNHGSEIAFQFLDRNSNEVFSTIEEDDSEFDGDKVDVYGLEM
ncbi:hypothetical protein H2198_008079 [Neophaeococcomyces mojaviensis]|uniref:Uncharacterized protein n=1 Tax=Neophaeococcomyces mojaviensis TaxID=3383035 RepID=A0ACC2ZYW4_9EURO|nr:hypothetical protein H2198_008079 [Knufia sp. JES_112]